MSHPALIAHRAPARRPASDHLPVPATRAVARAPQARAILRPVRPLGQLRAMALLLVMWPTVLGVLLALMLWGSQPATADGQAGGPSAERPAREAGR